MIWRASLFLLLCVGCAARSATVVDAFPPAAAARPWILHDETVWRGTFDEAADALGDDAETWKQLGPRCVWLARYCHEERPRRCLTVRCFAFDSSAAARQALVTFRPAEAQPFRVGDDGCWTSIGVMFRWGLLVFDVFGPDASWHSELQAAYLARCIESRMPPGVPDSPQ